MSCSIAFNSQSTISRQCLTTVWCLLNVVLWVNLTLAAALQTDDFQSTSTEGWIGDFVMPPTLQPTGGPAGVGDAFLLVESSAATGPGSHLAAYNTGSDWTGDYSGIAATTVRVDLMSPITSSMLEMRMVLFGPQANNQRWTSSNSAFIPNDGNWRTYKFSLLENDLTSVLGASSYAELMGNVIRFMLRHDADAPSSGGSSINGSLGVDNLQLMANTSPFAADFDGDGDVDREDLTHVVTGWQSRFGSDLNGSDFLTWQRELGSGSPLPVIANSVPEPDTFGLLFALALFGIRPLPSLRSRSQP